MTTKRDIIDNMKSKMCDIIEANLNNPREAVLKISRLKLPNGKKINILNAEILYEKHVYSTVKYEKDEYRFNNSAYIKRCNNLIRRSQIKKKKKKK
jgi:hypothetical protein